MPNENNDPLASLLIERFRRAAIVSHFGYEDEDVEMQRAGIASAKRVAQALDTFGSSGRSALIPLLEDSDPGVRVFAAAYLMRIMPERALSVLKEIDERCPTRANMTASNILARYERGELNM